MVVDDLLLTSIREGFESEVQRITQRLAERVKKLEDRYADTLPELEAAVMSQSDKVKDHLKNMGLVFNG